MQGDAPICEKRGDIMAARRRKRIRFLRETTLSKTKFINVDRR